MATNTRNRVIYQSEALYVGQPSATGCHVNATIDSAPGKLFGLIKHPESIDELCVFDWTNNWLNISTPVDLDIEEFKTTKVYKKGDIVKVTETTGSAAGEVWHFECQTDLDPDSPSLDNVYTIKTAGYNELFADANAAPEFFEKNTSIRDITGNDAVTPSAWITLEDQIQYDYTGSGSATARISHAEWTVLSPAEQSDYTRDDAVLSKMDAIPVFNNSIGASVALFEAGNEYLSRATEAAFDALPESKYLKLIGSAIDPTNTELPAFVKKDDPTAFLTAAEYAANPDKDLYTEFFGEDTITQEEYNALPVAGDAGLEAIQGSYIRQLSQKDFDLALDDPNLVDFKPIKSLKTFTYNGAYNFESSSLSDWTFSLAVRQLNRVQSANYSFAFNRQDVNQFGQLHRIDSVAIDPPTVSLDFSYYLNNGANEKLMGFFINDYPDMLAKTAKNFINIKDQEDDFEGRNYFILTTPQGEDAVKNDAWNEEGFPQDDSGHSCIALGNGYVTNYGIEASVGGMPTASVTVEGLNLKSDAGFHNKSIPAVDNGRGTPIEGVKFSLPPPVSGVLDDGTPPDPAKDGDLFTGVAEGFSCLRPGDIEMHLGTDGEAGLMNKLPAGTPPTDHSPLGCHVQSFSIDMPMGRTPLQRLGTPYAYTRPLDMPLTVTITVSAIVADLKDSNIADHLFNFENHDLHFILREPQVDGAGPIAMAFYAKGAQLEGESFSSSIGDNKSVDITFTCQVGGAEDTTRGLMVAGSRGAIPDKQNGETYDEYPLINRFDPATK